MKKEVDEIEGNLINRQMELRQQAANLKEPKSRCNETKGKEIRNHFAERIRMPVSTIS